MNPNPYPNDNVPDDWLKLPRVNAESATDGYTDGSNGEFPRKPSSVEDQWWRLGWSDGRVGQPAHPVEQFLQADARLAWYERAAELERKAAAEQAEAELASTLAGYAEEDYKRRRAELHRYEEARNKEPQEFSPYLGAFYLLLAVLLFLSDLPLSLSLVADGFNIDVVEGPYKAKNIFRNFLEIFPRFWEPLLLAAGIAATGVLMKFFIDDVVYSPETTKSRRWFAWSMLALFVVMTVGLGVFRAREQQAQAQILVANDADKWKYKQPPTNGATAPPRQQPTADFDWLSTAVFILLTTVLPATSGLCFASGVRKMSNWFRFRCSVTGIAAAKQEFESRKAASSRQLLLSKAIADQHIRESAEPGAWWAQVADRRLGLYRHGFSRGAAVPETLNHGEPLYQRCEKALERLLALELRDRIYGKEREK